ncbi:hypothetical protein PHMEG_00018751 [Phytophthora megakarya]|uniref:Avirulence (Avh) protein n=1 Tax=Phytophthora megakarya TaxID=4795 RepID=A0A225VV41_9STRA|nr:hypothetical protein PHMEG_00018751 [Phytophthora megakarya]
MILSNRNLKRWAAFVAKKTGTSPEETMITKLRTQYDDEFLAQLLLAEEKGSSKEMVTKLQNALFNKWHEERKMPALKVRNEVWIPAGPVSVTYMKFLKKKGLTFGRESNRRIRTQHPPAF